MPTGAKVQATNAQYSTYLKCSSDNTHLNLSELCSSVLKLHLLTKTTNKTS